MASTSGLSFNAKAERARMLDASRITEGVVSGQGPARTRGSGSDDATEIVCNQPGSGRKTNPNDLATLMGQGGK